MALTGRQRRSAGRAAQYLLLVAAVVTLALMANWGDLQRGFFDLAVAAAQFPDIVTTALINTVVYTAVGFSFAFLLGLVLALMRLSSVGPYRWIAAAYVELFRGLPALLVFIAFGFGVPIAFHLRFTTLSTVMLALGLVGAAYIAETLRAGIQAVPTGQIEAARSLGMSPGRAMVSIVIPQAFRIVLPSLTNELILLVKDSSLVYLLGLTGAQYELAKFGRDAMNTSPTLTPVVVSGLCYLIITIPLSYLSRSLERRGGAAARTPEVLA
ncbi:MAG: amino acid ABC transporter permease [Kutzneria sp.]|nr:amino acid ABC transporter permease [Kutzneria sp.]MBV9845144.1 amino acid ABC transporter permease [Kutzneria sp.]